MWGEKVWFHHVIFKNQYNLFKNALHIVLNIINNNFNTICIVTLWHTYGNMIKSDQLIDII